MGAPRQFPVEYDECIEAIEHYKQDYYQGTITKPSIPDFLGTIGANTEEYMDVINKPNDKNIPLSKALKNFGTWMDGKIMVEYPAPLAKIMLSQGFGGHKYLDKQEIDQNVKVEINVLFDGVLDAFG